MCSTKFHKICTRPMMGMEAIGSRVADQGSAVLKTKKQKMQKPERT